MTNDPGVRAYYTWDNRNRLVHVSEFSDDHEVLIVDYKYDAFNQLIRIRTDKPFETYPTSTVLAYDGGQVALRCGKSFGVQARLGSIGSGVGRA